MGNIISESWQFATVAIRTAERDRVGTGILIGKGQPPEFDKNGWPLNPWGRIAGPIFLVTAQHVLGGNASVIGTSTHFEIDYNTLQNGSIEKRTSEFKVREKPNNWVVHPNPRVDLACLEFSEFLESNPDIYFKACPLSEVANPISMLRKDINAADDVYIVGYPAELAQGSTALPVARKGILARSARRQLIETGQTHDAFLVDGAIIPGSSGSPVICATEVFRSSDLVIAEHRPILLGIVTYEYKGNGKIPYLHLGCAQNSLMIMQLLLQCESVTVTDFLQLDHDTFWTPELGIGEWSQDIYATSIDARTANEKMHALRQSRLGRQPPPS